MSERFRFDKRVKIPEPPEGMVVVKFFGLPTVVCEPCDGDEFMGNSKITERQLRELGKIAAEKGVANLADQKQRIANGDNI